MPDYRALHNQYAQGMAQPGTVQPNSVPGFNFLQGWSASPHAGFLPPQQARQNPLQYGTPTQGGWRAGANGQAPAGAGNQWMINGQDPRAMLHDGIKGNFEAWQNGQSTGANDPRAMLHDGNTSNFRDWRSAYNPNQQPMQTQSPVQYDQYGKPIAMDTTNPGRAINPNPWGGG